MTLKPTNIAEYHVFIASPKDMDRERQAVRDFFREYNRNTVRALGVRFEVIDWENYSTIGVGCPQELITRQTLERYQKSLALVIGLLGQTFGCPTGTHESGTEEEFQWALDAHQAHGFPEIKWFFRRVDQFIAPPEPERIQTALEQWEKVRRFQRRLREGEPPVYYKEFDDSRSFLDILQKDLSLWLSDPAHPWLTQRDRQLPTQHRAEVPGPPSEYYKNLFQDFRWLDIAGIDTDRAFRIPLSELYVRLRVISEENHEGEVAQSMSERTPIAIEEALNRYARLVIVGDPGEVLSNVVDESSGSVTL